MTTQWIKQPRAIFTANQQNADNGLLVQDGIIIELVQIGRAHV